MPSFLGAPPDEGGLTHYLATLQLGVSKSDVLAQLANSKEARLRAKPRLPGLAELLDDYRNSKQPLRGMLRRLAKIERTTNRLEVLTSRAHINDIPRALALLTDLLQMRSFDALSPSAFTTSLYLQILGRQPDSGGLQYYTGQVEAGRPRWQIIVEIASSNEARARYGDSPDLDIGPPTATENNPFTHDPEPAPSIKAPLRTRIASNDPTRTPLEIYSSAI